MKIRSAELRRYWGYRRRSWGKGKKPMTLHEWVQKDRAERGTPPLEDETPQNSPSVEEQNLEEDDDTHLMNGARVKQKRTRHKNPPGVKKIMKEKRQKNQTEPEEV